MSRALLLALAPLVACTALPTVNESPGDSGLDGGTDPRDATADATGDASVPDAGPEPGPCETPGAVQRTGQFSQIAVGDHHIYWLGPSCTATPLPTTLLHTGALDDTTFTTNSSLCALADHSETSLGANREPVVIAIDPTDDSPHLAYRDGGVNGFTTTAEPVQLAVAGDTTAAIGRSGNASSFTYWQNANPSTPVDARSPLVHNGQIHVLESGIGTGVYHRILSVNPTDDKLIPIDQSFNQVVLGIAPTPDRAMLVAFTSAHSFYLFDALGHAIPLTMATNSLQPTQLVSYLGDPNRFAISDGARVVLAYVEDDILRMGKPVDTPVYGRTHAVPLLVRRGAKTSSYYFTTGGADSCRALQRVVADN